MGWSDSKKIYIFLSSFTDMKALMQQLYILSKSGEKWKKKKILGQFCIRYPMYFMEPFKNSYFTVLTFRKNYCTVLTYCTQNALYCTLWSFGHSECGSVKDSA